MHYLYFFSIYLVFSFFKGWVVSSSHSALLAALVRARYRRTGELPAGWFVYYVVTMALAVLILGLIWPILLLQEGLDFFRPYNSFASMRNAMRAAQRAYK